MFNDNQIEMRNANQRFLDHIFDDIQPQIQDEHQINLQENERINNLPNNNLRGFDPFNNPQNGEIPYTIQQPQLNQQQLKQIQVQGIFKNIKKHRPSNTIIANIGQKIKSILKQAFRKNDPILEQFQKFYRIHEIKCQMFVLDSILTYVLYLKDVAGKINKKRFITIQTLIDNYFHDKLRLLHCDISKQKMGYIIQHSKLYLNDNSDYHNVKNKNVQRKIFYSSLILKKQGQVDKALEELKYILECIQTNQHRSKQTVETKDNINLVYKDGKNTNEASSTIEAQYNELNLCLQS